MWTTFKLTYKKSWGTGLNRRPHPYQGCALPTELPQHQTQTAIYPLILQVFKICLRLFYCTSKADITIWKFKAGNGVRTRNIQLGRLALCQLSYPRNFLVGVLVWSYNTSKKKICQYLKQIFFKKYANMVYILQNCKM